MLAELAVALHPRVGSPWFLGMHQCSHARVWSELEKHLFAIAGRKINHVLGMRMLFDELKHSEMKLAAAQSLASLGYWEADVATESLTWSDKLFEMHGMPGRSGAFSTEEALALVHPDDRDDVVLKATDLADAEFPISLDYRICLPSGEIRWMASRLNVEFGSDAAPSAFFGVTQDVTRLRQREVDELRLRQRLAQAQEYGKAGVWDWDPANGDIWWSKEHFKLFGIDVGQDPVAPQQAHELIHPEDREMLEAEIERCKQSSGPLSITFRVIKPDGEEAVILYRGQEMISPFSGKRIYTGIGFDITEQRAQETRYKLIQQRLEEALDFNNILVGILGNATLCLRSNELAESLTSRIKMIEQSATRASQLTRQMLAYVGRGQQEHESFTFAEQISQMQALLDSSVAKKVELRVSLDEDAPVVDGDPSQFTQVVLNLVVNAAEAIGSDAGVIELRTGRSELSREDLANTLVDEDLPPGLYAYLEVQDNGCGMDEETQKRIFDPFFTRKIKGHGLGLAAVLGIVRGHKGAIKVQSELGVGTSIRVLFPARNEPSKPIRTLSDRMRQSPEERFSGRALVVDDEASVREVAAAMLESVGFEVDQADDGLAGAECVESASQPYALVLLDMNMPRMGGDEAFTRIRKLRSDQPVVLMSGYNRLEAVNSMGSHERVTFLQKPFDLKSFRSAISEVINEPLS